MVVLCGMPTIQTTQYSARSARLSEQLCKLSSHGQLVTHTHVSSHSQLVTSEHITKPPVPVVIISARRQRHPETVLNTNGVITAICVTLMYTADYRSRRQITHLRKARSTRHNAVKYDGQLVTRLYDVTSSS